MKQLIYTLAAFICLLNLPATGRNLGEYDVWVGPNDKERKPMQLKVPDGEDPRCDGTLLIWPERNYSLAESKIKLGDTTLWHCSSQKPWCHQYNLVNAFSSREYVQIEGKLNSGGNGGNGGQSEKPKFWVEVPSVDIDWDEYQSDVHENGEDDRVVILPRDDPAKGGSAGKPFTVSINDNFLYDETVEAYLTWTPADSRLVPIPDLEGERPREPHEAARLID